MAASRLILGTVQFGLHYGVANKTGKIGPEEGAAILRVAQKAGVSMLDTAILYGDSEATLGALGVSDWRVISKLPEMPEGTADANGWVGAQVTGALARLRVAALQGLLLHRPAQLTGNSGPALYQALVRQREEGRVRQIGVSVYGPHELDTLPTWMKFDIVQAPCSVLDQRMRRSGWAQRLQAGGCELHARSVFLQGLMLLRPDERPQHFSRWLNLFEVWDAWLKANELSPLQACIQHVLATPGVTRLVVGVDSAGHLSEVLDAATTARGLPELPADMDTDDAALLNPALWSTE